MRGKLREDICGGTERGEWGRGTARRLRGQLQQDRERKL